MKNIFSFFCLGYQHHNNEYPINDEQLYHAYPYDNTTNSNSVRNSHRSFTHRRTSSNTSGSISFAENNINNNNNSNNFYNLDSEERPPEMYYSPYTRRAGDYSGYFSRQNSIDSTSSDRPIFLDINSTGTKLRSSMKKSNYMSPALRSQNAGGSSSSGPGI